MEDYVFVGSPFATVDGSPGEGVEQWTFDTQIEIPSARLVFGFSPRRLPHGLRTSVEDTRTVNGIDVRIVSYMYDSEWNLELRPDANNLDAAYTELSGLLPQLEEDFGPLPTSSLTVILESREDEPGIFTFPGLGPMGFYGAIETTNDSLKYELFSQYFGAAGVIFKTYRDSWLGKAVARWYMDEITDTVDDGDLGDMLSFVLPNTNKLNFEPGIGAFDRGPKIIQRFAESAGGRDQMIAFLRWLYENHSLEPMSTLDFVQYFKEQTGSDLYDQVVTWCYNGHRDY
jgi:hypothetical protein